ncbi:MAG TPA: YtxH domain-containing protein [Candidatus Dormibacteraeota bacterium]|jgi:gas vesicle protein|nr:YtxH domain-containing protein [Candidatus Dormibacteraeota bacterium]
MGYVRGVMHGMVIGTAIGVCIAPQEGSRTRAQIARAVEQGRIGMQRAQETARTVVPKAQSAARSVAEAAVSVRDTVEKIRHHEDGEPYVSVNGGNGRGSAAP